VWGAGIAALRECGEPGTSPFMGHCDPARWQSRPT
jgi:hypothetical protein